MNSVEKNKITENLDLDNSHQEQQVDIASDKLANYFYKISNHVELIRIGKNLCLDVDKGVKNFAFTSTGYKNSQQRTILGLCCFINQAASYKVAIISDHLTVGVFADLVDSSILKSYHLSNKQDFIKYKSFRHHFDFIDYSEFFKYFGSPDYTKNFDEEVKIILSHYDAVLWDIPEMETIKRHSNFHYRMSQFYQSMTIVVSSNGSSVKDVDFIKKFFGNYNIHLKGVLFDTSNLKKESGRKRFLGIF